MFFRKHASQQAAGAQSRGQMTGQMPGQVTGKGPGQKAGQVPERVSARAAQQAPVLFSQAGETLESLLFLKTSLRRTQKGACTLALANLLLLCTVLVLLLVRPAPVYFGMSQDMKLLPMTPLSEPVMNEPALKNWVASAVARSFNLDYLNWKRQLNDVRSSYTRKAFIRFALSLDKEGHLPLLRQQRALMHAVIQGTPVLTRSGIVQGTMVWEFELPVLVSYETSVGRISNNAVTIVCQVQRVPATDYPQGVAISSLVTTKRIALQQ